MPDTRRTRLQVLALEDRTVPALVIDLNGTGALTSVREAATGQSDAVTLSVLPGNRMNVTEGTADLGTYPVARNMRVDLGTHSSGFLNRLYLNDNVIRKKLSVNLDEMFTQYEIIGGTRGHAWVGGDVLGHIGVDNRFILA